MYGHCTVIIMNTYFVASLIISEFLIHETDATPYVGNASSLKVRRRVYLKKRNYIRTV